MDFLDIKNISERFMDLINPTSPEKVMEVGHAIGLKEGDRVLDIGCGFGELLVLWAEHFGIQGVVVEVRSYACDRAKGKIEARGLSARLEIICQGGAEYPITPRSYDVIACLGATFPFGIGRVSVRSIMASMRRSTT